MNFYKCFIKGESIKCSMTAQNSENSKMINTNWKHKGKTHFKDETADTPDLS